MAISAVWEMVAAGRFAGRLARSWVIAIGVVCVTSLMCHAADATHPHLMFDHAFAPQQGLVAPVENPMRTELCLNGSWQFQPVALPAHWKPNVGNVPTLTPPVTGKWDAVKIRIPSPWNINAFPYGSRQHVGGDFRSFPSYPQSWNSAEMGWLRRTFRAPETGPNRRLILHFEAVAGAAQVLVNGKLVGTHFDNFLPFEFDITNDVHPGDGNTLLVGVRRPELFDKQTAIGRRPYPAGSMWAESVVGIWQDVYLLSEPAVRVTNTYIKPLVSSDALEADVALTNDTAHSQQLSIAAEVDPWINLAGKSVIEAPEPNWRLGKTALRLPAQQITLAAGESRTVTLHAAVDHKLALWSPDAPNLYGMIVSVKANDAIVDKKYTRFGYRQLTLSKTSLVLNGKPIALKGDAWHFLGIPEMTRRYAWAWFKAVKAANLNAVRLHAQPYPPLFLNMADEQGVMILDETAIWGSDGSSSFDRPIYWKRASDHVHDLVMRDRNHPSVLGYSLTNEVLVMLRNRHATPAVTQMVMDWYTKCVKEIHRIDPNHPWISADGDEDAHGRLPVLIGHYGGMAAPLRWSKQGKPWGVGESGMAYYGTPKQVAEYSGSLAYESMAGRMDGVARQAYDLIAKSQIKLHAAYSSVFNIVWYGLKPLPLGLPDTTRPPTLDDGVWFGPFKENTPGVQPERLGPYCTTLNPGYDPHLPLYKTWPLFDAIKAADSPAGPQPSPYDTYHVTPQKQLPLPTGTIKSVPLLSGDSNETRLELSLMGVPIAPKGNASDSKLLIISGLSPPPASAKTQIDRTLSTGGTVLVWQPQQHSLAALNALLPQPLQLTKRTSTSLIPVGSDSLTRGITPADLYFTELKPDVILMAGLAGPLIDAGHPLLTAPVVDWRVWNGKPEIIKTGSVARSEAEAKPSGVAMAETDVGGGHIVVCNVSGLSAIPERVATARRLLANMGIMLQPTRDLIAGGIFSNGGMLRKALFCGRFSYTRSDQTQAGPGPGTRLPAGAASDNPQIGTKVGNNMWKECTVDKNQQFDLDHMGLTGPDKDAAAYASFWINSPRALDDVLGEPDVPRVDLLITGSDRVDILLLNGKPLHNNAALASDHSAKAAFASLILKRGWNHLVLRITHHTGHWEFGATLHCSSSQYLSSLHAAVQQPSE